MLMSSSCSTAGTILEGCEKQQICLHATGNMGRCKQTGKRLSPTVLDSVSQGVVHLLHSKVDLLRPICQDWTPHGAVGSYYIGVLDVTHDFRLMLNVLGIAAGLDDHTRKEVGVKNLDLAIGALAQGRAHLAEPILQQHKTSTQSEERQSHGVMRNHLLLFVWARAVLYLRTSYRMLYKGRVAPRPKSCSTLSIELQ